MRTRTFLMVAAILGVIAYLIFGPVGPLFGPDARTAEVRRSSVQEINAGPARPSNSSVSASPEPALIERSAPMQKSPEGGSLEVRSQRRPIEWQVINFGDDSATLDSAEIDKLTQIVSRFHGSRPNGSVLVVADLQTKPDIGSARIAEVRRQLLANDIPESSIRMSTDDSLANSVIIVVQQRMSPRHGAVAAAPPRR